MAEITKKISKEMSIGEVLKLYPAATQIIEKYFGKGCFTCPGMKMENIAFGAMMHGMKPEIVVDEINKLIENS